MTGKEGRWNDEKREARWPLILLLKRLQRFQRL
ncbi:MAG: hypothetical protein A4E60_03496 [Syntrophorhabdus sp. PtaB.Bin047]|nr:MAG: hypothetical protein A4E60_03496 [Syntrophorhabdus sp. PtaB.Bin047]